eukprot:CAMPEP_0170789046 /NCGR_PEP_ID=MMETSP0733-20121128/19416_1 /TAXON_ID=186038 /ORGANISM="Fragilariopsis kerguelensis, Strain L26-C5" /LENGTH=117 /DNA_ID=CAMNT_0011135911 /DNA_START=736 /DNA_END=1086 /DNA_ORIENTATION=-
MEYEENGEYTSKVDLWSVGVLIHALATGKLSCEEDDDADADSSGFGCMCGGGAEDLDLDIPDFVSNKLTTSLLEGLLEEQPTRRLSLEQVQNHCFLREMILLQTLSLSLSLSLSQTW